MSVMKKLRSLRRSLRRRARFNAEYKRFKELSEGSKESWPGLRWADRWPILNENTPSTEFDRHYVYHTAWAARKLREQDERSRSLPHHDFSSMLFFSTIVSAFRDIRFYDYRPAEVELPGLQSLRADLTDLNFETGTLESVSCMHVVEHIGLGRYGDPLDPMGDCKAMKELQRVLAPGGDLYFVVPVGRPRICFNAHRIYSFEMVRDRFDGCELHEFSLIPDGRSQGLIEHADPGLVKDQGHGCGCFWFKRKPNAV